MWTNSLHSLSKSIIKIEYSIIEMSYLIHLCIERTMSMWRRLFGFGQTFGDDRTHRGQRVVGVTSPGKGRTTS